LHEHAEQDERQRQDDERAQRPGARDLFAAAQAAGQDRKAEQDQQRAEEDREIAWTHAQRGAERIVARNEHRRCADGDQHQAAPDVLVVQKGSVHRGTRQRGRSSCEDHRRLGRRGMTDDRLGERVGAVTPP
jgi:hypothetical protein